MLAKIILTTIVILLAFLVLRQRSLAEKSETTKRRLPDSGSSQQSAPTDPGLASDLRTGAYLFLVLMVGLGAALYYFRWQDDHSIITVTLHRDNQQAPVTYEVYKYQLGERSFTTVDGLSVTVAASERMEVQGLED